MVPSGRIVFHCALVALAVWLASPAAAHDPNWYEDIQYLTWDVRADEAEAARAGTAQAEVFLQPSPQEREMGWYASCGEQNRRLPALGGLPRQIVGAFQKLAGKTVAGSRSIFGERSSAEDVADADAVNCRVAEGSIAISQRFVR